MVVISEAETVEEVVEEEVVDPILDDPVRLILMTYLLLLWIFTRTNWYLSKKFQTKFVYYKGIVVRHKIYP